MQTAILTDIEEAESERRRQREGTWRSAAEHKTRESNQRPEDMASICVRKHRVHGSLPLLSLPLHASLHTETIGV